LWFHYWQLAVIVLGIIAFAVIFWTSTTDAGLGAAALALSQGEQCKKNLQGETQYASMLHDERDQYEQQDAALVIQRDELKKQIQELGKEVADLQTKLGVPHQQITIPAEKPVPQESQAGKPVPQTQPGWPNPSPK